MIVFFRLCRQKGFLLICPFLIGLSIYFFLLGIFLSLISAAQNGKSSSSLITAKSSVPVSAVCWAL